MSILSRLGNLIKSNLNAAVDKLSDPAKEIDLLIEEMEEELSQLRATLRDQLVQEKLAQKKVDEEFRNVQKWQDHAERAVRASDDELAREALRRRVEAEARLEASEKAHAEQSRHVQKLTQDLKDSDRKIADIKMRKASLKLRAKTAKQAANPEGTAMDRFNRLVAEIETQEEQAAAMAELVPEIGAHRQDDRDRATEEKFNRLLGSGSESGGKEGEIESRLAALKAKQLPPKSE
jgi:phage shock protein A